jgi:hypothetical protein
MNRGYKIFTSGKMGGLSYLEQMEWRRNLEKEILLRTDKKVIFIHPPLFFDYDFPDQRTAKEWEINQVMDSDIVVYDLSNIKDSIGTHIEMGIVQAVNRLPGKHIATIGIGKPNTDHPWIKTSMFYQVADIEEAADFICTYLLI